MLKEVPMIIMIHFFYSCFVSSICLDFTILYISAWEDLSLHFDQRVASASWSKRDLLAACPLWSILALTLREAADLKRALHCQCQGATKHDESTGSHLSYSSTAHRFLVSFRSNRFMPDLKDFFADEAGQAKFTSERLPFLYVSVSITNLQ